MGSFSDFSLAVTGSDAEREFPAFHLLQYGSGRNGFSDARRLIWMEAPTVELPSSNWSFTAFMAAFSINATIAGVANTGRSPEPIVSAVFSGVT